MSRKIEYNLKYRKDGEQLERLLSIDFISNRTIREYSEIMAITGSVQAIWNKISDLNTEIGSLKCEKNNKGLIAIKQNEIKELNEQIIKQSKDGILEKRFELIKRIFKDNKIDEDYFYTYEFWYECVEPGEIIVMLYTLVNKDFDDKKKAQRK